MQKIKYYYNQSVFIYIFLLSILFGFTFNFIIPHPVRMIAIAIFLLGASIVVFKDVRKKHQIDVYMMLYFVLLVGLTTLLFNTVSYSISIEGVALNVSIVLGFFLSRYYHDFKTILLGLILLNFIVLIIDTSSGAYFFNPEISFGYESDRGRGLFSYSKECGAFILFSSIMYRNSLKILMILLMSAVMTGSRAPMIFVFFILVVEYYYFKPKFNTKNILLTFIAFLLLYFSLSFYFENNNNMLLRILGSFNFDSGGTHDYRFYIWQKYLDAFFEFDIIHLIFGNPFFLNNLFGNGPENGYLEILSNGGLSMLVISIFPLMFLALLSAVNFHKFYPFILILIVMQFARYGGGWADGVILWAYVFYIYHSDQTLLRFIQNNHMHGA